MRHDPDAVPKNTHARLQAERYVDAVERFGELLDIFGLRIVLRERAPAAQPVQESDSRRAVGRSPETSGVSADGDATATPSDSGAPPSGTNRDGNPEPGGGNFRVTEDTERLPRNAFGPQLRGLRERCGITMGELAEHLGVRVPVISHLEVGNTVVGDPGHTSRAVNVPIDAWQLEADEWAKREIFSPADDLVEVWVHRCSVLITEVRRLKDESRRHMMEAAAKVVNAVAEASRLRSELDRLRHVEVEATLAGSAVVGLRTQLNEARELLGDMRAWVKSTSVLGRLHWVARIDEILSGKKRKST